MHPIRSLSILSTTLFVAAAACSDQGMVDIGRSGDALSDYAASWVGYTEAWMVDPTSDAITLTLDATGQGTLFLGDDPDPGQLPADPNVGPTHDVDPLNWGLAAAVRYTVYNANVEASRLRISVNMRERYRDWCAAQTSIPDENGIYKCVVNNASATCDGSTCTVTDPQTGQTFTYDYDKFVLCTFYPACDCNAQGCTIGAPTLALDAALEDGGDKLTGTLAIGGATVHMTRQ
jgi:hypothetical protein